MVAVLLQMTDAEAKRWALVGQPPKGVAKTCAELPSKLARFEDYKRVAQHVARWTDATMGKPRILCWVFTSKRFHANRAASVKV